MTATKDILAADTAMGAVTLKVANLDRMIGYYQQGVGLSLLAQEGDSAILGRPGKPSLVLELAPELQHASMNAAGLFHTAFLFDSESRPGSIRLFGRPEVPQHLHRQLRPLRERSVLLRRPRRATESNSTGTATRALWKWNGNTIEMGTRLPRPEPLPAGEPH
jgi:catechol 2,3-dioxygenase